MGNKEELEQEENKLKDDNISSDEKWQIEQRIYYL